MAKKIYRLKTRLFYREPNITQKLRAQYDRYLEFYGKEPKEIYMTKKELGEYLSSFGSFQQIFYKGKDILTGRGPMFRGAEVKEYTDD